MNFFKTKIKRKVILIVPGDSSMQIQFNLGLAYIARILLKSNIQVNTLCCDIIQPTEYHLASIIKELDADIFGISAQFASFPNVKNICRIIKNVQPESIIIIGGSIATPTPEFTLTETKADIACIGEGEDTIIDLLETLMHGSSIEYVKGIAYVKEGTFIQTESRNSINLKKNKGNDYWPAWEVFPIEKYITQKPYYPFSQNDRVLSVITSRGCPYKCNFCYNPLSYRLRDIDDVLNEIIFLNKQYDINGFYIEDDLLMVSKERIIEFCQKLLQYNLQIKYTITGRFNIVDYEILKLLKSTGCVTIFYGIESGNQKILDNMNKKITIEQIYKGVSLSREIGIFCRFGVMFGQPDETEETLNDTMKLLKNLAYGNFEHRVIYGCIPFPGSNLYEYCISKGLIKNHKDFYDRFKFKKRLLDQIPVNMTKIKYKSVEELLYSANKELLKFYRSKLTI